MKDSVVLRGVFTRLLARAFVKDWREPQRDDVRAQLGYLGVVTALLVNLLLAALKLGVGLLIGSLALLADGLDSTGDLLIGLASLVGIRVSSRAPDPEHPYGHERAEEIATVVVATLLVVFGLEFAYEAASRFYHREYGSGFHAVALAVAGASVVLKLGLSRMSFHLGAYVGNPVLTAGGWNYFADVMASVLSLAALVGRMNGILWLDPLMAIAIAAMIIRIGLKLILEASGNLLGRGASPQQLEEIHRVACGTPGVVGCRDIEVHHYGRKRRVSLRIRVPESLTLREGHRIAERVQEELLKRHADWEPVVHVEPVASARPAEPA